jgi:hypothetical protein
MENFANVLQVASSGYGEQLSTLLRTYPKAALHVVGNTSSFYTSKKIKIYHEVNSRIVYGMRAIGKGENMQRNFVA